MDDLRVETYRDDPPHLVLAGPDGTRFRLGVDDLLCEALEAMADGRDWVTPVPPPPAPAPPAEPSVPSIRVPAAEARERSAPNSRLAPRQIQALLRAGNSTAQVARAAATDEDWVRRWLPPIEAERTRVVAALGRSRIVTPRRGQSPVPLEAAVRRHLSARGVDPDGAAVSWSASRAERSPSWTITLRFRTAEGTHRATWRYDPESGDAEARSSLAAELSWSDGRPAPTPVFG